MASTLIPSGGRSYEEVLDALAAWVVDPKNGQRLLDLVLATINMSVEPYTKQLGLAYRRIYRRPTTPGCSALMRVEAQHPKLYHPHSYYAKMRDQLVESFEQLESQPVFSNPRLRRDLIELKTRTLTLFFTPQLVRSRARATNERSLIDALDQLATAEELDFDASLFYLRRSLDHKNKDYNPTLLTNLSFLAYRRYEHRRRAGSPARRARSNLDSMIYRMRRYPKGSRPRSTARRTLIKDWADEADAPEALEAWGAMVAGEARFEPKVIARRLR